MQTFAYTAREESGSAVNGTMQADSIAEVTKQLRNQKKYPISVKPVDERAASSGDIGRRGIKISRKEVVQFTHQLAIMMETGVTLSEALDCISDQAIKPNVKALVEDLGKHVQSGTDFSAALLRHPRSFPRIFIALVKAAEKSGMMSKLLHRAAIYMRDEQDTVRRVRGALTYPAIMFGFAMSTTIFLLAFVLPRFTTIYASKGAALPVPTRILMAMSGFLIGNWMMLLIGIGITLCAGYFYISTTSGTRLWHWIQLHTPLLGSLFRKLHLSRGLRMIGTMAGSGVNLMDCVSTAHDLCPNVYFRELWDNVSRQIQTGKQMSEPLATSRLVPRSFAQMIHSGEKGGKLAHVTEQVATFAEQELKETITELTRYIEPAMIVVMGVIIGGVSLALLLPIFTISKVMSH